MSHTKVHLVRDDMTTYCGKIMAGNNYTLDPYRCSCSKCLSYLDNNIRADMGEIDKLVEEILSECTYSGEYLSGIKEDKLISIHTSCGHILPSDYVIGKFCAKCGHRINSLIGE